jgi:peptidoglycan/xylan/chitin deacetylase (PgdA/CDA1 family)
VFRRIIPLLEWLISMALLYSGAAVLGCHLLLRGRVAVLMYHRVLPKAPAIDAFSTAAIIVTPQTFDMQMRIVSRFFRPLTMQQLLDVVEGRIECPPRACVITFDDGWFDNCEYAAPILQKYEVPAVVFVATGFVGSNRTFWQEHMTTLLFSAWKAGDRARPILDKWSIASVLAAPERHARQQIRDFVTDCKRKPQGELRAMISELTDTLRSIDVQTALPGDDRFMSWGQVAQTTADGLVAIGSHAHSHLPLDSLSDADLLADLQQANVTMNRELGSRSQWFAYPNGNYDQRVMEAVRREGHTMAFTTDSGWVFPGDSPLALKRLNVGERRTNSVAGFVCRLLRWM